VHNDRFWIGRFTFSPKNKCWIYLKFLRNHGLERKDGGRIRGIVGLHRHSFHLCAGAIANVESCGDLTFFAGRHFLFLGLRNGTAARGVHGFEPHWFAAGVLIFEMADRFLIAGSRVQFDSSFFPFQLGVRGDTNDDRQSKSKDVCSHFFE
jgi:hypothetical protein